MKKLTLYIVLSISSIIGMDADARMKKSSNQNLCIKLKKEHICEYQKKFDPFVKKRRWQARIISNRFGGLVASIFSDIDIDEARAFLNRVFEDEEKLKQAAKKLQDEDITYLQGLLSKVNSEDICKKNSGPLAALMKTNRHPALTSNTGKELVPWNKDEVDDDTFYRVAACSFMSYVIVEEEGSAKQIKKEKNGNE